MVNYSVHVLSYSGMMLSVPKTNRFDLEAAVIPKRQVNDELRSLEQYFLQTRALAWEMLKSNSVIYN